MDTEEVEKLLFRVIKSLNLNTELLKKGITEKIDYLITNVFDRERILNLDDSDNEDK